MNLLLDTNIVIYYLAGDERLAELLDGIRIHILFITELELLSYPDLSEEEISCIKDFLNNCTLHNLTDQIKSTAVKLRRKYNLKLPDCIIAATSISADIPLISADRDFSKIEELPFIDFEV